MIRLYFGKCGAGKDTIVKEVLSKNKDILPIVSYTTRPKRPKEVDGVDYNFVSTGDFLWMIDNNKLTEYRKYHTINNGAPDIWYYGTPILDPMEEYAGVVDIQGAYSFLEKYDADLIDLIYIKVDDDFVRYRRVVNRGGFDNDEWKRRAKDDDKVFSDIELNKLCKVYGRPIACMHNNERLTFDEIEYKEDLS